MGGKYSLSGFIAFLDTHGIIHQPLSEFIAFLDTHVIIHQSSCSDTSAQNGRAKRKHRHLLDTARSLLLSSFVLSIFGGETVLTAAYFLNRMPTRLLLSFTL